MIRTAASQVCRARCRGRGGLDGPRISQPSSEPPSGGRPGTWDLQGSGAGLAVFIERPAWFDVNPAQALISSTRVLTVNVRAFSRSYDGATRTITDESPEGRRRHTTLDAQGRMIGREVEGLYEVVSFGDFTGADRLLVSGKQGRKRAYMGASRWDFGDRTFIWVFMGIFLDERLKCSRSIRSRSPRKSSP